MDEEKGKKFPPLSNRLKELLLEVYRAINAWLDALDEEEFSEENVARYDAMVRARDIIMKEVA